MDEAEADYEEELFDVEEISNIVKYSVDTSLSTCDYQNNKVGPWVNSIVETSLSALTKLQKSYKYIVTCVILEKNGAGLVVSSACVWDKTMDGSCTVRWENKTICCIVNVFGLAI